MEQKLENLNFEQALNELEKIVTDLETGKTGLEESITCYERGIDLKKHCEKKLKEAQCKIEKITINDTGTIESTAFTD